MIPEILSTPRLRLRRSRPTDAPAIFEYGRDPEVTRYMDWKTHDSIAIAETFLRDMAARWESGEEHFWVITEPPDDRAIGGIAFRPHGKSADFGYVLRSDRWGRGIMTEATVALLGLLRAEGFERIVATCDVDNIGSIRVLEKSGLVRESLLRDHQTRPNFGGVKRDCWLYSIEVPFRNIATPSQTSQTD